MPRQPAMRRAACFTSSGKPVSTGTLTSSVPSAREQPPESIDHRVEIDDVLEHFHADDGVVSPAMRRRVEAVDGDEREARHGRRGASGSR